jgi:hypothetical protein
MSTKNGLIAAYHLAGGPRRSDECTRLSRERVKAKRAAPQGRRDGCRFSAELAAPRDGIVEIAGLQRAPFNEMVARYLKAVDDAREVVSDPKDRYWDGRVEEHSLVPLREARLGRIGLDEWLRHSQAGT